MFRGRSPRGPWVGAGLSCVWAVLAQGPFSSETPIWDVGWGGRAHRSLSAPLLPTPQTQPPGLGETAAQPLPRPPASRRRELLTQFSRHCRGGRETGRLLCLPPWHGAGSARGREILLRTLPPSPGPTRHPPPPPPPLGGIPSQSSEGPPWLGKSFFQLASGTPPRRCWVGRVRGGRGGKSAHESIRTPNIS